MKTEDIESKLAFLERHVEEQDKTIFELTQKQDVMTRQLKDLTELCQVLRQQLMHRGAEEEKPPHY